jgi:hypothetical protein
MTKSKGVIWMGHVARMRDMRNAYKVLLRKCYRKRPLQRSTHGWKNNIRMDLTEIGWEGMDWTCLGQERDQRQALAKTVMNI